MAVFAWDITIYLPENFTLWPNKSCALTEGHSTEYTLIKMKVITRFCLSEILKLGQGLAT